MDVFDIGEGDLQALAADRGKKKAGRFSTEKAYFQAFIYTKRFFGAFQVLPPAVFPMKVAFSNPREQIKHLSISWK